ncbi:hypothetical protein N825_24105 [Skermanella stibiiresistens SB22]|uniref:STAS domain-containing protein n=1 Tax=Skermanella stibiiresistens SB22 TaxID=1385369 RepID=W9H6J5_9PROT|nr:STAS domain-containing protein [Skermanella stibiiresistens]EWY41634.1 hypothetical protein N825_24105 [Skermanella stibiiresistens SB22]
MVNEKKTILVRFAGSLTVPEAAHIRSSLLDAFRDGDSVEVDCSGATDVDLSFVQLLLAARRTAVKLGKSITLSAPAAGALLDTLARGGLLGSGASAAAADHSFWMTGAIEQP